MSKTAIRSRPCGSSAQAGGECVLSAASRSAEFSNHRHCSLVALSLRAQCFIKTYLRLCVPSQPAEQPNACFNPAWSVLVYNFILVPSRLKTHHGGWKETPLPSSTAVIGGRWQRSLRAGAVHSHRRWSRCSP